VIIHVYTTCRNEQVMMPFFLRHYEQFADHIFVLDDGSNDGTQAIVASCSRATLLPYGFDSGLHEDHINQAYIAAYKVHSRGAADWVLFPDVDEMLWRPEMREALFQAYRQRVDVIPSEGYLMVSDGVPQGDGQLVDMVKTGVPHKAYDKTLIFNPAMDFSFNAGRHSAVWPDDAIMKDIDVLLLHYCYLSPDYIRQRLERNFNRMLWKDPVSRQHELDYRVKRAMQSYEQGLVNRTEVI
jgi:hypothetical protein